MKERLKKFFNMKEQDLEDLAQEQAEMATEGAENIEQKAENVAEPSEITQLKSDLADAKNKYLLLFADFDNFRRNSAKERVELRQTAGRDILSALLPILDDFDRAQANGGMTEGTTLIHQKLVNTLQSKQLVAMEVQKGDPFDADQHEAIANIPAADDAQKGKIIEVLEKGYLLGDKIIRYAKVVVGF